MAALDVQIEAYAFRELVAHLQWRTDVQNIDIMNLAGFCRNCLSKWVHAGSKVYGATMDYDEACKRVYGEPYKDWKKKHQAESTPEQMQLFKAAQAKHARTDPGPLLLASGTAHAISQGGHSNVCGQECDTAPVAQPLADSSVEAVNTRVAVLTCSDRASRGVYEDKSGPTVTEAVANFAARCDIFSATVTQTEIVPDEEATIAEKLKEWSSSRACDVIFTTGGTGFGPRDVTPEATRAVLQRQAEGLARAMSWQTSFQEPHSILSRGVCGVTAEGVLIVNLPGKPAAVRQCLSVLLPVLPHALRMLKS